MSNAKIARDYLSEETWDVIFDALGYYLETYNSGDDNDAERYDEIDKARNELYKLFKETN